MTTKPARCGQVHRNVLIIDDNEDLCFRSRACSSFIAAQNNNAN